MLYGVALRMDRRIVQALRDRLAREVGPGTRVKHAPLAMTLCYPSPYHVAMSSLGYLQIHRLANQRPGTTCERAILPEPELIEAHVRTRTPLLTLESQRPAADAHLIGISHAYELELTGIVQLFDLMGLAPLARDRGPADPLVVLGGPITFSNPLPSAPFADVVVLGEGEASLQVLLQYLEERPEAARGDAAARKALLETLADVPGFFVPRMHGERLPPIGQAPDAMLPAVSEIRTPDTELSDMVLIEPERGCHRGCTFCVMRRTTNGGMRLVSPETVRDLVPDDTPKVGLVGAAVTDHPRIKTILSDLVDRRGKRIGVSSLRADRLDEEFVGLLARGGYRSMTVALDAASVRLRDSIEKGIKDRHIERAAALARGEQMRHLKLYVIVNLPGETEADLEELVQFGLHLKKTVPVVLGVSPFVPKFHTPLAAAPFAGEQAVAKSIKLLQKRLAHAGVQLRGPGAREAYVEYRLAQGGFQHAEAAIAAARAGGSLADYKRALADLPDRVVPANLSELIPAPTRRRNHPTPA
ncbi:MAG: radical SAM protein [Myxococcales bacterium]|nr:radical SAM protein [Myxococcales bacterium]MCB9645092.1 radical SAM protein [Deltaproteobacteria bacterium]